MALHVVVGNGNLGCDLQIALDKAGHEARLYSKSLSGGQNWEWPESAINFEVGSWKHADTVWCCAGGYSVGQCEDEWSLPDAVESLFELPVGMALALPPEMKLVVFSTDYVVDEHNPAPGGHGPAKSVYAAIKIAMEEAILSMKRPNTLIVRVGSLYGAHFPERTFPWKVKANHPLPGEVLVPRNFVTPTPTWWVADKLVEFHKQLFGRFPRVEHMAPYKGCTLAEWAQAVLGPKYAVKSGDYDAKRPRFSQIGMSFSSGAPTWLELWLLHLARHPTFPGHRTGSTHDPQA